MTFSIGTGNWLPSKRQLLTIMSVVESSSSWLCKGTNFQYSIYLGQFCNVYVNMQIFF